MTIKAFNKNEQLGYIFKDIDLSRQYYSGLPRFLTSLEVLNYLDMEFYQLQYILNDETIVPDTNNGNQLLFCLESIDEYKKFCAFDTPSQTYKGADRMKAKFKMYVTKKLFR